MAPGLPDTGFGALDEASLPPLMAFALGAFVLLAADVTRRLVREPTRRAAARQRWNRLLRARRRGASSS